MATSTKKKIETEGDVTVESVKEPVEVDDKIDKGKVIVTDVDIHQYITVKNGFQGRLVYRSKRTGEKFVWHEFGDEQEMELQELKGAKSSSKGFFIKNWFMFPKEFAWVIKYLGMEKFYANALPLEDFDDLFEKKPAEIKSIISKLSNGQKRSVEYRARQLIRDGEIDSNKAIAALEEALGAKLIER